MSSTTVKINGVEVSSDGSKPTVININLNQPSALASLLAAWKEKKTAPERAKVQNPGGVRVLNQDGPKAPTIGGDQKVLGAIQIILGLVCVSIAVLFCFVRRSNMFRTGSGFWTGFPLIVAGAFSVVSGKRGNKCWLIVASLFNLAAVCVAIAGIVINAGDFSLYPFNPWNTDTLCDQRRFDYGSNGQRPGPETSFYRIEDCKERFYRLVSLFNGVRIMLLVVTSLALCVTLSSLGYGYKRFCCNAFTDQEEEAIRETNDQEPLITSPDSTYPVKPKMETV